jgi:hypothetical protein
VEVVPLVPCLPQTPRPAPPVPRATVCSYRGRATAHHPVDVGRIPSVVRGCTCSHGGVAFEAHKLSCNRTFRRIGVAQELHEAEEVPRRVQSRVQVRSCRCHYLRALLLPRSSPTCSGLGDAARWHRHRDRRGVRSGAEVHRRRGEVVGAGHCVRSCRPDARWGSRPPHRNVDAGSRFAAAAVPRQPRSDNSSAGECHSEVGVRQRRRSLIVPRGDGGLGDLRCTGCGGQRSTMSRPTSPMVPFRWGSCSAGGAHGRGEG